MEDIQQFSAALENAIEQKKQEIERDELPKLKEKFRVFMGAFHSLYDILLRKSLINEDPYKYDQKISEISSPSTKPFMESEKIEKISVRLSQFESQLDFLNHFYQFGLDFLNLKRIKALVDFMKFIKWNQISDNASQPNTRVLGELVAKVRQGNDKLSINIINDSIQQMEKANNSILISLKTIADFQKEYYKYRLRGELLTKVQLNPEKASQNKDHAFSQIKRSFAAIIGKNMPFYPEFIQEIIDENYSSSAQAMRREVLGRLETHRRNNTKKKDINFKPVLLDAVRILSSACSSINIAIQKLSESHTILENRKQSFTEKLREWLQEVLLKKEIPRIYEIEIFNTSTSTSHTEKLVFDNFKEQALKRARILSNVGNKMSPYYRKLEASAEDQIYNFLNTNLQSVHLLHKKMPALETYMKSEMTREERKHTRSIKMELMAIKNSILKANQKKHDYVSRIEEREQLKRLGINPDEN